MNTDYDDAWNDVLRESRYNKQLMNHPNCSDPDHPGCEECEPEEYDYEEE